VVGTLIVMKKNSETRLMPLPRGVCMDFIGNFHLEY